MPSVVALVRDLNLTSSDAAVFTVFASATDGSWSGLIEIEMSDLGRDTAALNRELAEQVATLISAASGAAISGTDVRLLPEYRLVLFPKRLFSAQKNPGTTGVALAGITGAPTTHGTPANIVDSTGEYIRYTSGAPSGSRIGWYIAGNGIYHINGYRMGFFVKTDATNTSMRFWIGLSSDPGNEDSDTPPNNMVAFRYSTGAPDTNWMLVTSNGTTQTTTDSGIAFANSTRYEMDIDATIAGQVSFYINRVLAGVLTTNLPSSTQVMYPVLYGRTLLSATRLFYVSHVRGETL